jgi:DNA-binding NarL/FixJ family response regulator
MTGKQKQVWALLAQGQRNADIARALALSEKTIKGHCTAIFKHLGVKNRTQAALVFAGHCASAADGGAS